MGGPDMAPHTPPSGPRSSQGLDRAGDNPRVTGSTGDSVGDSPVPVITQAHVHVHDGDLVGRARDALVLTAEERRWGRRRVQTRDGRALALALPTGSVLPPGAVLYVGADWYVVVEAAEEPVIAVRPRSREEALAVAFEVGNRHFTLAIDGDRLLVPDDTAMEHLLTRLAVPWSRTRGVFVPVGIGHRHDS
jgi:urease accessory protein